MTLEWLHAHEIALWWIGISSVIALLGTLIMIPVLAIRIPVDYFKRKKRKPYRFRGQHPVIRFVGLGLKNFLGILFILLGLAMLVLPGQGVITILIGIMMLNFPGKFALERRIVQEPNVLRVINWMRAKANKPALQVSKGGLREGRQLID
jgi:hypothetical protein